MTAKTGPWVFRGERLVGSGPNDDASTARVAVLPMTAGPRRSSRSGSPTGTITVVPREGTPTRARLGVRRLKRRTLIRMQRGLHYTGIARVAHGTRRVDVGTDFLSLMYHSVVDAERRPFVDPVGALTAATFDQHLATLRRYSNPISLSEAVAWMNGEGRLPPKAVVVTFDDGYLDSVEVAAPLLDRYEIPAAVFVPTGYIDRQAPPWIDELYCAFTFRQRHTVITDDGTQRFDISTRRRARRAYAVLSGQLLAGDAAARRTLLDEVKSSLEPSKEPPRLTCSWDDLRLLRERHPLIEIGLHGHDHTDLSAVPCGEACEEVRHSMGRFASEMGYVPRFMSYPYGRYSASLRDELPNLGIEAAFSCQPADRTSRETSRWSMSRLGAPTTTVDLRLWAEGVLPSLGRRVFGQTADHV